MIDPTKWPIDIRADHYIWRDCIRQLDTLGFPNEDNNAPNNTYERIQKINAVTTRHNALNPEFYDKWYREAMLPLKQQTVYGYSNS